MNLSTFCKVRPYVLTIVERALRSLIFSGSSRSYSLEISDRALFRFLSFSSFFGYMYLDPSNILWRVSHASFIDSEVVMSLNVLSFTPH